LHKRSRLSPSCVQAWACSMASSMHFPTLRSVPLGATLRKLRDVSRDPERSFVASCCRERMAKRCGMSLNPVVQVWHVGMYRDPKTLVPIEYYNRFTNETTCQIAYVSAPSSPPLQGGHVRCQYPIWPVLWLQLDCAAAVDRLLLTDVPRVGGRSWTRPCRAVLLRELPSRPSRFDRLISFPSALPCPPLPVQRLWCTVWSAVCHGHQPMCQGHNA
jgi:hypothetical protein